jgi:hypothetical protein
VLEAALHAVRLDRQAARRGLGADRREVVVAAEDVGATARVDLRRGQHGAARPLDRPVERHVLRGPRRLGELHVVDDQLRAGPPQLVDHLRVQRTGKRPAALEVGERDVVDADDHHVVGRRHAAQVEAGRDRAALEVAERARRLERQGRGHGHERGHEQGAGPAASRARHSFPPSKAHGDVIGRAARGL